jgi:phospholipase C
MEQTNQYIILLVLENRSFDSVLGTLPHVEGIRSRQITQRVNVPGASKEILDHVFRPMVTEEDLCPRKDPNEEYQDIYECFANRPWVFDGPQLSEIPLPMNGFATNFYRALKRKKPCVCSVLCSCVAVKDVQEVLNVLSPRRIPVLTSLAYHFGVADHYHCDVPSCTLPNRAFLQSGNSHGNVTNGNYTGIESWLQNTGRTLYDALSEKHIPWKVYYDIHNVIPLSFMVNFPSTHIHKDRFVSLDELLRDLRESTLPRFSLVEPRFLAFPADCHPIDSDSSCNHNSIIAGEQFLFKLYESIRRSKLRDQILFLVTFDEGGGLADHVSPPKVVSPYRAKKATEMKFDFKTLGQRVPFIAISSTIPPQTVWSQPLQHTSLIRTLCEKWKLSPLNARDRHAPVLPDFGSRLSHTSWPDLSYFPLRSCILSGHNPYGYVAQKWVIDQVSKLLNQQLFTLRSEREIEKEARLLRHLLQKIRKLASAPKTRAWFEPWFEVRFFFKKTHRQLSPEEQHHVQNCLQVNIS